MPTLVLVRHGQSQWNLENRFTGWWDVDLTDKGVAEAQAAGDLDGVEAAHFGCSLRNGSGEGWPIPCGQTSASAIIAAAINAIRG